MSLPLVLLASVASFEKRLQDCIHRFRSLKRRCYFRIEIDPRVRWSRSDPG